jgi:hypothetical protein
VTTRYADVRGLVYSGRSRGRLSDRGIWLHLFVMPMLYCHTVEEDPVSQSKRGVEGRGLDNRASGERTALLLYGPSDVSSPGEMLPFSRNSRWLSVHSSISTPAKQSCQTPRSSAARVSRPDSPSIQRWQGLSGPSHAPAWSRTASKE